MDDARDPRCVEPPSPSAVPREARCTVCGHTTTHRDPADCGRVRGNTERFWRSIFELWRCPSCGTIANTEPADLASLYEGYPLNRRRLDYFARGALANLLRRLVRAGLRREHTLLDYGCGNGVFLDLLRRRGYRHVSGYDPYVDGFRDPPPAGKQFDCVVANDLIEHCDDPPAVLAACLQRVRPGGLLYVGTADSTGIEMHDLEPHIMRLHQPFHRRILSEQALVEVCLRHDVVPVARYRRSYMDTWLPFVNYRFFDEFNRAHGHVLERNFAPQAGHVLLTHPRLVFFGLFGYLFPIALEPALILRRCG